VKRPLGLLLEWRPISAGIIVRVFNFSAGPAMLPFPVLEQVREELPDWQGSGMSVMEVSHRGKAFIRVAEEAEADLRELLSIPSDYKVLFLSCGATGQFAAIPLNLATWASTVDYVNTGSWSKKAIGEARTFCSRVHVVADAKDSNYSSVPPQSEWNCSPDAAYLHYTPTRPSAAWSFPSSLKRATCRWRRPSPRSSCRVRWT